MVLYGLLKRAQQPEAPERALPLWSRLLAGGGANVLNIAAWYPLNTVLHVQQSELPPGLATKLTTPTKLTAPTAAAAAVAAAGLAQRGSAALPRSRDRDR